MRIASPLVAFMFLGLAAAAAVPSIASRNGGSGGHTASLSGVHSHHSGIPTGASLHGTPSLIPSHAPASRRGGFNSSIHSLLPDPTSHLPSGTPIHSSIPSHAPASRRVFFNSTVLHSTIPPSQVPSGTPAQASSYAPARRAQPTGGHTGGHSLQSGSHSRASDHPTPSAGAQSHSHGAHSSGAVGSHTHSDASVQPTPTITQAPTSAIMSV